jgi:hypothetical protein
MRLLARDNDPKSSESLQVVLISERIEVVRTPIAAPQAARSSPPVEAPVIRRDRLGGIIREYAGSMNGDRVLGTNT